VIMLALGAFVLGFMFATLRYVPNMLIMLFAFIAFVIMFIGLSITMKKR